MHFLWSHHQRSPSLVPDLFVDDFIYFNEDPVVEQVFKEKFRKTYKVDFGDECTHFLELKFTNVKHSNEHLDVYLSQQSDIDVLVDKLDYTFLKVTSFLHLIAVDYQLIVPPTIRHCLKPSKLH